MHKFTVRRETRPSFRRHPFLVEFRTICSCGWFEKSFDRWTAEARGLEHVKFPHRR